MSRAHVNKFYKEQIKSLLSMQKTAKQMEEAYNKDEVTEETYRNFIQLTEILRTNVDRISYIVFLLNQPRFNLKNFMRKNSTKSDYFRLHKADQAGVFAENNKVLDDMQRYIELMQERDSKCKTTSTN